MEREVSEQQAGGAAMGSAGGASTHEARGPSLMSRLGLDGKHFFDETAEVRLSDVKVQLDSDSDKDKLLAMKRLLAMISKGRDVSALFPDVVKNVVSKNVEIRKIVYMFLVHFAELRPQEALLAINSLQKAMSDSNQLLRANALRCMSNIRVREIAQLIVLAVQKGAKDSSPYVRKTAALAIPKVMRLDTRHSEQCVELVGMLLRDPSTVVVGAAVQAFLEVCPGRFDLVHAAFRRICTVLPDVEEWGQVAILTMLLRYGRAHFVDPNKPLLRRKSSSDAAATEEEEAVEEEETLETMRSMDPDHRLILQASSCLLQSRNNAVVLAASVLHFYLAPDTEVPRIAKPMVRLLHANRETRYVALLNIATMAAARPQIFSDHVSEFFVNGTEPLPERLTKLELLTMLANEQNITKILREMREYARDEDKTFVAAAIQAIGRCAAAIPEVADNCMQQLLQLMANPSQTVVAEAVVVIKQLLQINAHAEGAQQQQRDVRIIRQLAKLLDTIQVPQARAAIVWLVGEYSEKVPQRAPDVLRVLAKNFVEEADVVRLQIVTLAAKLFLASTPPPPRAEDLLRYVLQLAKYDQSYDIRDRARLVRQMLFSGQAPALRAAAKQLLLAEKPVPALTSASGNRSAYTLASLSHAVHDAVAGYEPLSDFPEVAPDPTVRNPVAPTSPEPARGGSGDDDYDDALADEGWGGEYGVEEEETAAGGDDDDVWGADQEEEEGVSAADGAEYVDFGAEPAAESEVTAEEDEDDIWNPKPAPAAPKKHVAASPAAAAAASKKKPAPAVSAPAPAPAVDPLDELFGPAPTASSTSSSAAAAGSTSLLSEMASLSAGMAAQQSLGSAASASDIASAASAASAYRGPATGERALLLKPVLAAGLSVEYAVCRRPSLHGPDIATVTLYIRNTSADTAHTNIRIGKVQTDDGSKLVPFPEIPEVAAGASTEASLAIHFASFTKAVRFELVSSAGTFPVSLLPAPGDLVRPSLLAQDKFLSEVQRLSGMYKTEQAVEIAEVPAQDQILLRIQEAAYVAPVIAEPSADIVAGFVGEAIPFPTPVLVVVRPAKEGTTGLVVAVHTENAVIGSILLKQLAAALKK